ncbi:hypothetical protein BJV77DRAFT_1024658 [Russula vinacea]|nr:hypothetical protein BJV77DRAFT_1024658 [Russula vinacea]
MYTTISSTICIMNPCAGDGWSQRAPIYHRVLRRRMGRNNPEAPSSASYHEAYGYISSGGEILRRLSW